LHWLADCVVTNSHSNRLRLEHSLPGLRDKVVTIYNMVDLNNYCPGPNRRLDDGELRLLTLARHQPVKNACGLIEGLAEAKARDPGFNARLDWYGDDGPGAGHRGKISEIERARSMARRYDIADRVYFHGPIKDTVSAYRNVDAVVLPSFFEGLPNTICEAMACGCPVLQSNICDAGNLVHEGINGFLFDPSSPRSIADALLRFSALTPGERLEFGAVSRRMAERLFSENAVVNAYERVLSDAAARTRVHPQHWIPEVPESSFRMATMDARDIRGL
jgi:glycosyltransferase involved in cell wall biosynthesis